MRPSWLTAACLAAGAKRPSFLPSILSPALPRCHTSADIIIRSRYTRNISSTPHPAKKRLLISTQIMKSKWRQMLPITSNQVIDTLYDNMINKLSWLDAWLTRGTGIVGEEELPLIPRINFINSPLSDQKESRDENG